RVRQLIDVWFSRYPTEHRAALIARFRSPIDHQHYSAFFELLLHELVVSRGLKVVAIEPKLVHTTRSPDFLIEHADGKRFYLEAALATGQSQEEIAAQARLNQALAAIEKTPSPAHFLDLYVDGVPTAPVATTAMQRRLKAWIKSLPDGERAAGVAAFV